MVSLSYPTTNTQSLPVRSMSTRYNNNYNNNNNNNNSINNINNTKRRLFIIVGLFGFILSFAVYSNCFSSTIKNYKLKQQQQQQYNQQTKRKFQISNTIYKDHEEIPLEVLAQLDVIIILGGGAPSSIDDPPIYVQQRCDDAVKVIRLYNIVQNMRLSKSSLSSTKKKTTNSNNNYNNNKSQNIILPILALSGGTAHLPQLISENNGLPIWESTSSVAYLHKVHNIPYNTMFVETTSYDTIGNAYYTRTIHTEINQWRKLLIITNKFHMIRTKAIFDWIFSLPSLNDNNNNDNNNNIYELYYLQSLDKGLSKDALHAREEKEMNSIVSIQQFTKQYTTLYDVWKFLHTNHSLYTAEKLVQRGYEQYTSSTSTGNTTNVSDLIKKSYGGGTG